MGLFVIPHTTSAIIQHLDLINHLIGIDLLLIDWHLDAGRVVPAGTG